MASRIPALRGWLVVLVLGVLAGLWGVALLGAGGAGKHTPGPVGPAAVSSTAAARLAGVDVLHTWDGARSRAWAAGDVERLRSLYVAGSSAGRVDVALLRRYLDRGLVVTGMRRQVLGVHVEKAAVGSLRLRVTDRLVGAVARSAARPAAAGRILPSSRAVTRAVVLRRSGGVWRVASVRVVGSSP